MTTPSPWGRTRSGHSTLPIALAAGVGCASVIALLTALLDGGDVGLAAALGAAALAPCALIGWVGAVDRSSIASAPLNPEQSVESTWYDRAVRGAFHDVLIVIGLSLVALSAVPALRDTPASLALPAVVAVAAIDVAVRYQIAVRREG